MIFTARVKQSTEFDMTIDAIDEGAARAVVEEMDGVLFVGDAVLPVTVVIRITIPRLRDTSYCRSSRRLRVNSMRQSREKVDPMNGCTGDSFGSCIEPEGRGTFGLISQEYIPDAPSRET